MLVRADSDVALSGAVEAAARLQKVARFEKAPSMRGTWTHLRPS